MVNLMGEFTPEQAETLKAQIMTFAQNKGLSGEVTTTTPVEAP
jgi:hypothetical protein